MYDDVGCCSIETTNWGIDESGKLSRRSRCYDYANQSGEDWQWHNTIVVAVIAPDLENDTVVGKANTIG